ncbi:hypothetical protein BX666DRAFT_2031305 [Dichotomocladium elegans]|nr:hypothetical protein BX666DRAFT_2031305 [Dichotomocladium elegans]
MDAEWLRAIIDSIASWVESVDGYRYYLWKHVPGQCRYDVDKEPVAVGIKKFIHVYFWQDNVITQVYHRRENRLIFANILLEELVSRGYNKMRGYIYARGGASLCGGIDGRERVDQKQFPVTKTAMMIKAKWKVSKRKSLQQQSHPRLDAPVYIILSRAVTKFI